MNDALPKYESRNLRLIGHTDMAGSGDGMQVMKNGTTLYVGHMGKTGTSVLDISDPRWPRVVRQIQNPPNIHCHKVQFVGDILLVNHELIQNGPFERTGIAVYDVSKPQEPRELSFFQTGGEEGRRAEANGSAEVDPTPSVQASRGGGDFRPGRDAGVHRIWFADGRYAYASAWLPGYSDAILMIVDLLDPTQPREVGRWWVPGVWAAGGEQPSWQPGARYRLHHPIVNGDRAYLGYVDYGMVILDVSDRTNPKFVGHVDWSPEPTKHAHTALPLPGRKLVISTDEALRDRLADGHKNARVIDISDETSPRVVAKFPEPMGDFAVRGGRFGTHNLHENRPGTWIDEQRIFVTYFNAGLRVYDTSDPLAPREIAYFLPESPPGQEAIQLNDLLVDSEAMIYVTDRIGAGLYIVEPTW